MNKKEKELLNWALQNTTDASISVQKENVVVDEELMEAVLGKSDAKRMVECVEAACNEAFAEHVRLDALDELEMLVESTDNATDMEKLRLWSPLISTLTKNEKINSDEWKKMCLWVIGTAAQNNPQAQEALCEYGVLREVLGLLDEMIHEEVRRKAFYVVSAMAKPKGSPGHVQFLALDGPNTLSKYKEDAILKEKIEFLLDFLNSVEQL